MPLKNTVVGVTNVAVLLASGKDNYPAKQVFLQNTSANPIFLGPAGITAAGYSIVATTGLVGPIVLAAGEDLYGIASAAGPFNLFVLETRA